MCAKFDINKTFNFKVMIKKPMKNLGFQTILEKKSFDPLYCNYPSARDCKNIWGNAVLKKPPNSPFVMLADLTRPLANDSDQHCIGGKGETF